MFFLIILIIRGDASRLEFEDGGPSPSELDDINRHFGNRSGLAVVWH